MWNRRHFLELAEAELERAARYGGPTSVAVVDIDHFKRVNDELGHAAGDAALRGLTAVLRRELRSVDVVGRLGGEEFGVLLPETPRLPPRRRWTACAGPSASARSPSTVCPTDGA